MEPGLYRRASFDRPWTRVDTFTGKEQCILRNAIHEWATAAELAVMCEIPIVDVRTLCARLVASGDLLSDEQEIPRYIFSGAPPKLR